MAWLARVLTRLRPSPRVQVSAPGVPAFLFEIHASDEVRDRFVSAQLRSHGSWEPFETRVFCRFCTPGTRLLDIGANIGWYATLAARLIGAEGSVLALEPDADNARLLRHNLDRAARELRNRAAPSRVLQLAAGDRCGEASLYRSADNQGDHRLFDSGEERNSGTVPVQTLDSLYADQPVLPDLVKCDTQGSEAKILRGASALLARGWRPIWILEFWPWGLQHSGDDPALLWQQLVDLGYAIYEINEQECKLTPFDRDMMLQRTSAEVCAEASYFFNLLCLPPGVAPGDDW